MGNNVSFCSYKPHGQNRDRISDLPDAILHLILSFLPIKSIAQTSLLSKRWSYLWASYPVLDFSGCCPLRFSYDLADKKTLKEQSKAMKFISTALSCRLENSNIKVFRFAGCLDCSCLHDFIGRVVKHRVEELSLEICPSDNCDVPHCLFECDSLRSFKLEIETEHPFSRLRHTLPVSKLSLRSLHTLSLTGLDFSDSALDDVDLFASSSFPSLERLTIKKCNKNKSHDFKVSSPNLKEVQISRMMINSLDISGKSLEYLKIQYCKGRHDTVISWIKIFAPNLRTLRWIYNGIIEKSLIDKFPVLMTSTLRSYLAGINTVSNLISASSQVQKLKLSGDLEVLSNIYFGGGLRYSFMNLETLHIYTSLGKCEIPGIACLFKSSPVVHTLILDIYSSRGQNDLQKWKNTLLDNTGCTEEQYWKTQAQNFSPFLCHLKVVKIYARHWNLNCAINTARFLLEHGRSLQDMIFSSKVIGNFREDEMRIIEGFPRASSDVKISFPRASLDQLLNRFFNRRDYSRTKVHV